jgi:V8-like Glu-specific endopeptidase
MFKFLLASLLFFSSSAYALSNSVAAEEIGWQSVVLIKIPYPANDPDGGVGMCNATFLDAQTLLTAAHCFVKSSFLTGDKLDIEIGQYSYIIKDGVKKKIGYKVTQRHSSSGKIKMLKGVNLNSTSVIAPELDIVIVKLDAPAALASDFIFATLWNKPLPQLTAAHKPTVVTINYMETVTHLDTKQKALLNEYKQTENNIYSTSTSRVAAGDSGGPLFASIEGKTYVIGVVKGTVKQFFMERDIYVTLQGRLTP